MPIKKGLDKVDLAILKELLTNAKQTYREIASKLNVPEETVRKKVEWMIANKYILGFTVIPNTDLLNLRYYYLTIKVFPPKLEEFISKLKKSPAVTKLMAKLEGLIILEAVCREQEFLKLLETIKNLGIKEMELFISLKPEKYVYLDPKLIDNLIRG